MSRPILYELFDEIRRDPQWGHPGLEEYYLLFGLLQSKQYPIGSFADIVFVLETLWLKSEQRDKFRKLLEQRMTVLVEWAAYMEKEATKARQAQVVQEIQETKTAGGDQPETMPSNLIGDNDQKGEEKTAEIPGDDKKEKRKGTDGSLQPKGEPVLPEPEFGDTGFRLELGTAGSERWKLNHPRETELPLLKQPYLFTDDYFPVANRQLQQAWRSLKNRQEGRDSGEMDIDRTIGYTARQGYFSGFLYEKEWVNPLQLFVFVDQGESMVAMREFGVELCNTARLSEAHSVLEPFFFNRLPAHDEKTDDYILTSEDWTRSFGLRKLFLNINRKDILVLIYSDAGALKGEYDPKRIRRTREFIRRLYDATGYIAWLNPAPRNRWTGTNAEPISGELPMYEASRNGLDNTIAALKGKLTVKNKTEYAAGQSGLVNPE